MALVETIKIDDLDIEAPVAEPTIISVEVMSREEGQSLQKREITGDGGELQRMSERHHTLARLLALGNFTQAKIGSITGYHPSTISILKRSPAFQELLAYYRGMIDENVLDYTDRIAYLTGLTLERLQQQLEENPKLTPGFLESMFKTLADRSGHGPVNRSQSLHVSAVITGEKLLALKERARQQSADVVVERTLEAEVVPEGDAA